MSERISDDLVIGDNSLPTSLQEDGQIQPELKTVTEIQQEIIERRKQPFRMNESVGGAILKPGVDCVVEPGMDPNQTIYIDLTGRRLK